MKNRNHANVLFFAIFLGSVGMLGSQAAMAADPTSKACEPVRHYAYTLAQNQTLPCEPDAPATIFNVTVPDTGRALMRVTYNVSNIGPTAAGIHGWSAQTTIGAAAFADQIHFGVGEDVCPGESETRHWLAYGELTAKEQNITITTAAYRSSACVAGIVQVAAGSTLDVWVEAPAAKCVEKDIVAASYFLNTWAQYGSGTSEPTALTTSFSPSLVSTSLKVTQSSTLLVMGQSEISPASTLNQCGNRVQTAISLLTLNGGNMATDTEGYPFSGGMTHVLLSPYYSAKKPAGTYSAALFDAVNQAAQDGALAGATFSGDTVVGIVQQR